MTTEHHKHPCETVDASADVMKLAKMILSDCGCSTSISDSLQRRVAGRIQLHMDSVAQQLELERGTLLAETERKQQLQGQADALLAALGRIMQMDVKGHALQDRLQFSPAGRAILEQCQAAIAAAQPAAVKESLTADRQAEPVAWFYSDNFDKHDNLYRRTTVRDVAEGFARQGRRVIAQYDAAQPPAVAEGCGACGDGCKGQGCRLERESPPTCQQCNGKGMIGGLLPNGGGYDGEPCPDCTAPKPTAEDSSAVPGNAAQDAARYRLLRLGRCWSVIDGLGAGLQGEELDAAVDVALGSAAQKGGEA